MEKRVYHFDAPGYTAAVTGINKCIPLLQLLHDEFADRGLFAIDSVGELLKIASGKDAYVKSEVAKSLGEKKIGPYKMSQEAIIQSIEWPDFTTLNQLAHDADVAIKGVRGYDLANFLTIENGSVVFPDVQKAELEENYNSYIELESQEEVYEAYKAAMMALADLNKKLLKNELSWLFSNTELGKVVRVTSEHAITWNEHYVNQQMRTLKNNALKV